jgi:hypothetical protein
MALDTQDGLHGLIRKTPSTASGLSEMTEVKAGLFCRFRTFWKCIYRFRIHSETSVHPVLLQYKLRESEEEWRPRKSYDHTAKRWINVTDDTPGTIPEYSAILGMTIDHLKKFPNVLESTIPSDPDWKKMKRCILDSDARKSRLNWTDSTTASWNEFFQSTHSSSTLAPWIIGDSSSGTGGPAAVQVGSAPLAVHTVNPLEVLEHEVQCPEPFVAADKATADAWKASKRRRLAPIEDANVPADPDANAIVTIGDVIVVEPDEESRSKDIEFGYTLPISFGKVVSVDIMNECVDVKWLFCSGLEGKFSPWPQATQISDTVPFLNIIRRENSDEILKVEFTKQSKLTAASKVLLQYLLDESDHEN